MPKNLDDNIGGGVYKQDESRLFEEIRDRGVRQKFIESTAGATPPSVNVFISSINALGVESTKVQGQGSATAEVAAPVMPDATTGSTGTNTSNSYSPKAPSRPSRPERPDRVPTRIPF